MAYQRTEYHREVQRNDEDNKTGGWRSWFGLDNKDEDHRGYNHQSTATYRNGQYPSTRYSEERGPSYTSYGPGYTGPRGGYGYTTSDEVSRGPWTADRDYTTRPSYGQSTGEKDVYYKQETRTYGGDRDYSYTRPTGEYSGRSYTPSRGYGFSGERDYPTTTYQTSRDYPTTTYQTSRDNTSYPTTGRDYQTASRGYTSDYPTTGRGYSGYTSYDRDYTTPSRGYGFSGERDTYNTSRYTGHPETYNRTPGYRGDYSRETTGYTGGDNTYTRPSYQSTSYRY